MMVDSRCCLRVGRSAAVTRSTPTILVRMMECAAETSPASAVRSSSREIPALFTSTLSDCVARLGNAWGEPRSHS